MGPYQTQGWTIASAQITDVTLYSSDEEAT